MFDPVLKGLGFGLVIAVLPGPVFFALIQTAMDKGVKLAVALAFGIMLSDVSYMLITYAGMTEMGFTSDAFGYWVGLIGGTIMLLFGASLMLSKVKFKQSDKESKGRMGVLKHFSTGFLLNALNPAVVFFWIGVNSALLSADFQMSGDLVFFSSIALTIFLTDLLKVHFSHRLSKVLSETVMLWLKRIIGLSLFLFGCQLVWKALFHTW